MTSGISARIGIQPVGHCPIVDMAKASFIAGFVPASNDQADSQILVEARHTNELDDWPHLVPTLRTDDYTYYRVTGFGKEDDISTDEDDASIGCSACRECDVTECLLSTFSFLSTLPYECFWREEELHLKFAFRNQAELKTVVDRLRTAGYTVELKHLALGDADLEVESSVRIDLQSLTARQREALRVAVEGEYFGADGADTEDLADELGVSASTFSSHTRTAVQKLLRQTFDVE